MENLNKQIKYTGKGMVMGYLWSGSLGTTDSIGVNADSIEELTEKATELLDKDKLTGTGDFESQIGAILTVTITTTITVEGEEFINTKYDEVIIGDMTGKQLEKLQECWLLPY